MSLQGALYSAFMGQYTFELSGASITDESAVTSTADVRINADGTVDEITASGGTVQLSPNTDWIIPNQYAPGGSTPLGMGLQVQATLQSGDTPTGDTLSTWHALTSNRGWGLQQDGTGSRSCSLLIEIRGEGGAVFASGTYSLSVQVP